MARLTSNAHDALPRRRARGVPKFPPLTIPDVDVSDLALLFGGALGIALVSLADTISTASAFAARTGQEVRGNGEMIGIGAANLAAGLFQRFPVSTSGSPTAVAERSGAKTQLTGVTGAVLIVLMIMLIPSLFKNLPQHALAAVVITASLSWPISPVRCGCGGSARRVPAVDRRAIDSSSPAAARPAGRGRTRPSSGARPGRTGRLPAASAHRIPAASAPGLR